MNDNVQEKMLSGSLKESSLDREMNKYILQKNKASKVDLSAGAGREYKNMTTAKTTF